MTMTLAVAEIKLSTGGDESSKRSVGACADRMRVVLTDKYPLLVEGLRRILSDDSTVEVVAMACTAEETVKAVIRCQPDLLLLGIELPGSETVKLIREVCEACPSCKVLVLGDSPEPRHLAEIIMAGAGGYLLKTVSLQDLREAIEQLKAGYPPLDPSVAAKVMSEVALMRKSRKSDCLELKDRHIQILRLLAGGASNREMAEQLFLSAATIKRDMKQLFRLMKVKDRSQAVAKAYQIGIL